MPLHVASDFYDVDAFRAGGSTLRPFELEEVGPVEDKRLVHLQCHFGLDSLSWARAGASVAGLDFSAPAVAAANALATDTGLDGRFVCADVYDAETALEGERFDVVYTGLGALNWLPDLGRWAKVVANLLAPGGFVYLSEFHPLTFAFADDEMRIELDYFHDPEGIVFDGESGTYADLEAKTTHNATREWAHSLADVVSAVLDAGLRIELLPRARLHALSPLPAPDRRHRDTQRRLPLPPARGEPRLPLMYSLRARRD